MSAEIDANRPQAAPVSLTAEQASILLKGDLRNLAKNVQQGKTLSASERNLLQSALAGETPAGDEYTKNAVQLATILGVDRKTVQRWRKIDGNPGVRPDGRYHVPSWRAWKLARQGDGNEREELSQSILRAAKSCSKTKSSNSNSPSCAANMSRPATLRNGVPRSDRHPQS